ncbi:glycosyltransferase family 1 protein [Hypoxylon rubiginosum]|uniref:Glycosyltransferase family 1 protein n=1 Tax=Hypoxylon rubiginosum TaxID=110542 RepID=A0ACC0CXW0_9PEZI|nr:glycosyltransferase family 1 protein [Hypoxylon rubiginosum]
MSYVRFQTNLALEVEESSGHRLVTFAMSTASAGEDRPFILILCHTLSGHLAPLIRIAAALHTLGWQTFFLGPNAHRHRIEAAGSIFIPLSGNADLDDKEYYENPPSGATYTSMHWSERVLVDIRVQCLNPLPTQWSDVKAALASLHARDPGRGVIVLAEAFFYGVLPLFYGTSLPDGIPNPLGSVCVSVTVPAIRSVDLPPAGYPFPFDASPEGRLRNTKLWERSWTRKAADLTTLLNVKMWQAGAERGVGEVFLSGANYTAHNSILQLGVPSFEYPRSDWPSGFKFAGLVQGAPKQSSRPAPTTKDPPFPWWPEIISNSTLPPANRKKILVVSQGTVETNPYDLIIPTLRAFAPSHTNSSSPSSSSSILVVAILGWKDADLSQHADFAIPKNARVADYLSYDTVLAHADVWIHNAGFGAVNHGVANGVPMVVAGEGMDKTENARRVAWSGIGVDLGTATPSAEQVRDGVEWVLRDDRYSGRVRELQRESEEIDCFDIIHSELLTVMEERPGIIQRGLTP